MKNYLHYLQNVLGIRSVLLPLQQQTAVENLVLEKAKKLVVLNSGQWNKDETDLLEKMLSALKKETSNVEVIFFRGNLLEILPGLIEAQEILVFESDLQKNLHEHGLENSVLIPSPKILIANPELKRDAWEAMKKSAHRVN